MAQVLLFPSVLGARQGITDLADALTGAGEEVDRSAPKKWRAEAAAEKAQAFRKGR